MDFDLHLSESERREITVIADGVTGSHSLPDSLNRTLRAALKATEPPPSRWASILAEEKIATAGPGSWCEAAGIARERIHGDDWRP
jgi:hypothetical protein